MSSDMKKRTLRGRLRFVPVAGCGLPVAGWVAAVAGMAVASAAPAALVRKLRRLVEFAASEGRLLMWIRFLG
jgi:hypothetical protein